ncbi:5'/3'-nucleotidase SurE [bacterium]|nr:5'/3'-nucleotidase SurE [bacterium]
MKDSLILLTNDDGFFSTGIETIARHLKEKAETYIVAPDREKSATSLALTLHHPLRVREIRKNVYGVEGTPADCVYIALKQLLPRRPDLLISGLNHGPNVGQQDISYSGTVAGALQGTFLQIPSLAVSLFPDKHGNFHFSFSSKITHILADKLFENSLPEGVTLNVNIPAPPVKGIKITTLGERRYNPEVLAQKDPRDRLYYWIGTGNPQTLGGKNSDVKVVEENYISITPIHTDCTDYQTLKMPPFQNLFSSIKNEISKETL